MNTTEDKTTTTAKPPPQQHERLGITREQYDNLVSIRDLLRQDQVSDFNMRSWHHCIAGTFSKHFGQPCDENWHTYVRDQFGINSNSQMATFLFLFSPSGEDTNSSASAAADRLDVYLHGEA